MSCTSSSSKALITRSECKCEIINKYTLFFVYSFCVPVYLISRDLHSFTLSSAEIVVNIVIKTTPKSIARCKTFRSSEFFGNEINFFTKIFKEFDDFQQVKKDAKYPFNELPSCLASHFDGKNDFIVLENLEPFGYFTASRQKSMDIHVTRLVMRTLGRFHGLSFLVRDQSPKTFEEISVVPFETYYAARLKPWYHDFINHQISIALDAVKKIYFETEIEERAKKFLSDGSLYDKMVEMTHTRNRYSVIGHGDCWTPNFMINSTKVDGKDIPVKAKMIDYQLCRYASPVLDISFFIYSCTTQDIRDKYFDDLIKTYHDALTEIIRDFGSNPEFLFPMSALKVRMVVAHAVLQLWHLIILQFEFFLE